MSNFLEDEEETEYERNIKKKYPLDKIELEFEKIEKLGYSIGVSKSDCQIYLGNQQIIDADFSNDYHLNCAMAIDCFWNKLGYQK